MQPVLNELQNSSLEIRQAKNFNIFAPFYAGPVKDVKDIFCGNRFKIVNDVFNYLEKIPTELIQASSPEELKETLLGNDDLIICTEVEESIKEFTRIPKIRFGPKWSILIKINDTLIPVFKALKENRYLLMYSNLDEPAMPLTIPPEKIQLIIFIRGNTLPKIFSTGKRIQLENDYTVQKKRTLNDI